MQRQLVAIAFLIAVAGCHSKPEANKQAAPAAADNGKIDPAKNPKAFHDSIEQAMSEVPPAQRPAFQKVYECFTKGNNKLKRPLPVDASTIRDLTKKLKTDPTIADRCDA